MLSIIVCFYLLKEKVISFFLCTFGYSGLELSGFMIFPMMLNKQSNLFIQNIKVGIPAYGCFYAGIFGFRLYKKVFEHCQLIVGGEDIEGLFVEEY